MRDLTAEDAVARQGLPMCEKPCSIIIMVIHEPKNLIGEKAVLCPRCVKIIEQQER